MRDMRHATRPVMSELLQCSVPPEVKEATHALAARDVVKPAEIMRRALVKELRAAGILDGGERIAERRNVALA